MQIQNYTTKYVGKILDEKEPKRMKGEKMNSKKKILIVNDLVVGGGVEKLMYDLVMHWHDKYDITIMTSEYCKNFRELYPEDVHYLCSSIKKGYNKNIVERVYTKFKSKFYKLFFEQSFATKKFDVIIAIKDGWVMEKVAKMKNAPVKYAWVHTDYKSFYYTKEIFKSAEAERQCMKSFKNVVCVANTIKDSIIDVIGDPGNLIVKYNPIDVDAIKKRALEPVDDIDVSKVEDVTRFVTVGRLNYQKGYDLLLEACYMLEKENLKFEVWIVGDEEQWGDEHKRLYRTKDRLNLQSVKFLGGRKNPYKYMACGDWFLSSSIFEGFSLVSQEAAVLDIPQILTDCSGVRELLGDSEYGIVVGKSVLDIYEGMKRIIQNPDLHDHYKEKIIERKGVINFKERIDSIEDLICS